jgi:hypothetical protein
MAKHPAARQRRNAAASTSREIVLRGPDDELLPVPDLPARTKSVEVDGKWELVEVDWHPNVLTAWQDLWQYPLVAEAPQADHHLFFVYATLLDEFWRRSSSPKANITELSKEIRAFAEQWGLGEKSRRHLQITIQEAKEAMARGRKMDTKRFEQPPTPSGELPSWGEDDEDDGSIVDATVVES